LPAHYPHPSNLNQSRSRVIGRLSPKKSQMLLPFSTLTWPKRERLYLLSQQKSGKRIDDLASTDLPANGDVRDVCFNPRAPCGAYLGRLACPFRLRGRRE
jgi:hypothetical protein